MGACYTKPAVHSAVGLSVNEALDNLVGSFGGSHANSRATISQKNNEHYLKVSKKLGRGLSKKRPIEIIRYYSFDGVTVLYKASVSV